MMRDLNSRAISESNPNQRLAQNAPRQLSSFSFPHPVKHGVSWQRMKQKTSNVLIDLKQSGFIVLQIN